MNGKELGLVLNEAQAKNTASHHYARECARNARTAKYALAAALDYDVNLSQEVAEFYNSITEIRELNEQLEEIQKWADDRATHSGSLDVQGALHRANTTQNKALQMWNTASWAIKSIRGKLKDSEIANKYGIVLPETLNDIRDNAAFASDIASFINESVSNRQKRLDEYEIPGTFSKLHEICRFHSDITTVTKFAVVALDWASQRFVKDLQAGGEELIASLRDPEYQLNYLNRYIEDMSDYITGRAITIIGEGIAQAINQNEGDVFTFSRECSDKIPQMLADPAGSQMQSAMAKALRGGKNLQGLPEIFERVFDVPCVLA